MSTEPFNRQYSMIIAAGLPETCQDTCAPHFDKQLQSTTVFRRAQASQALSATIILLSTIQPFYICSTIESFDCVLTLAGASDGLFRDC